MAGNQPLAPLFEADRLAIIGASDRNHYAVNVFKNLQNFGFDTVAKSCRSIRAVPKSSA